MNVRMQGPFLQWSGRAQCVQGSRRTCELPKPAQFTGQYTGYVRHKEEKSCPFYLQGPPQSMHRSMCINEKVQQYDSK